jgi:beta-phosphoglucomutase-like phosphatase (HAD superfamily)
MRRDTNGGALHADLDVLSAHWRVAFWSAQDALRAAGRYLPASERRRREAELALEREATARLLDAVAAQEHVRLVHRIGAPRPTKPMLGLPKDALACVFELEGVLTGSAAVHAAAWAETFDELLLKRSERAGGRFGTFAPFDPRADYDEHIHGRPRLEGVRAFLASRGIRLPEGEPGNPPSAETVHGLANRKSQAFLRRLDAQGVKAYEGSRRYLEAAREAGLHCAVVSASANTGIILERAGLARLIDQRVDGNTIVAAGLRAWPAPDVLLAACRQLDVRPPQTAVFETAVAGIAAGRAGDFELVVGIDRSGDADALQREGADIVVGDLSELLDPSLAG